MKEMMISSFDLRKEIDNYIVGYFENLSFLKEKVDFVMTLK